MERNIGLKKNSAVHAGKENGGMFNFYTFKRQLYRCYVPTLYVHNGMVYIYPLTVYFTETITS